MSLLGAVAIAMFAALMARVWFLQIMSEQEFVAQAEGNRERTIEEVAPRGRILDVEGRVLVDNRPSIIVTIDKETIATELDRDERDDLFFRLAQEISASGRLTKVTEIETAYNSDKFGPFAEVPVVRDINAELQQYLAERSFDFPGVNSDVVTVRDYPYGNLAAHILGYVGALSAEEEIAVQNRPTRYLANDEIGKSGVELFFEDQLRGTPGIRTIEVDKFSNVLAERDVTDPIAGSDVQLSIDIELQSLVESELRRGLELARLQPPQIERETERPIPIVAPAGAIVILDPTNGSVLAMASFPTFDPGSFVNGISEAAFKELTRPDSDLPLLNRAIQGEYAPGSTFKPFTAYAAIDTGLLGSRGVLDIRSPYEDMGSYRIPGCLDDSCVFSNAGNAILGPVDLRRALTLSSDVYFYNLAANFDRLQFDRDSVQQAALDFGFGSPTGVQLPNERIGRIPTPESIAAQFEAQQAEGGPEIFTTGTWTTGMTLNTSIGQGDVLATPLQIATAYGAIANGGTVYAPNLATAVRDPITDAVEISYQPRVINQLYYPSLIADPIRDGLAGVTTFDDGDQEGTATQAFADVFFPHAAWPVAGKTGTSEKTGVADFALFAGFGPLPNPEYLGVVVLEEAGFGGAVAAPVLARIFESIATSTVPEVLTEAEQSARDAAALEAFEAAGAGELETTGAGVNEEAG